MLELFIEISRIALIAIGAIVVFFTIISLIAIRIFRGFAVNEEDSNEWKQGNKTLQRLP